MKRVWWSFLVLVALAEQRFSLAPVLAYHDWSHATSLARDSSLQWHAGRYQWGAEMAWHSLLGSHLFSGMQAVYTQTTTAQSDAQTWSARVQMWTALAGMRYAHSNYETRIWWGLSGRQYAFSQSHDYHDWSPSFGVSYGMNSEASPLSWHWGWSMTPGYYDYAHESAVELPSRVLFFLRAEWAVL